MVDKLGWLCQPSLLHLGMVMVVVETDEGMDRGPVGQGLEVMVRQEEAIAEFLRQGNMNGNGKQAYESEKPDKMYQMTSEERRMASIEAYGEVRGTVFVILSCLIAASGG